MRSPALEDRRLFWLFAVSLAVRLTALATPLVYRLTRRIADRRAALAASALHVLYPTFSFFAHSLWAEPLFVLLLLGAAERVLAARDAEGGARRSAAVAAGVCVGLACLTRTAGIAFLLALPVAFLQGALGTGRRRTAVSILVASLIVLVPWQVVLQREEGRPVLLATSSGLNFALGNNRYVDEGAGSTWTDLEANARLREDILRIAERRGLGFERAGAASGRGREDAVGASWPCWPSRASWARP